MDFIDSHKELFGTRRFVSRSKLVVGMFIQFTYDGEQKYAVVLNPDWQGKLHAFSVKTLTPSDLTELLTELKGITDPTIMYEHYKLSRFVGERPYRTYLISKMQALREIYLKEKKSNG